MTLRVCEVCDLAPAMERPTAFPGVPMVRWLCGLCRASGLVPYDLLVTWVWMGQVDPDCEWARAVAIFHTGNPRQFNIDIENFIDKMNDSMLE